MGNIYWIHVGMLFLYGMLILPSFCQVDSGDAPTVVYIVTLRQAPTSHYYQDELAKRGHSYTHGVNVQSGEEVAVKLKEQFADKGSSDIWDDFTNNTIVVTQQAAESGTNATVDPDQVWSQTVSEPSEKNRVFGIGGFLASTLRTSVFAPQASSVSLTSPAPAGLEEVVDLREQVQLLNQNIQDMARQLHEFEEQI
ncbi:hypothetical protein PIB30_081047 [Stylosanthes scabra]|uniref:Inhibitor I9 domain-containing protein n=1 Tax=Stylosanthes scabra TaxID=79078 RepID=A0ABU6QSH3_9FABA|nr:hypothetical protein [Stylosanthes scabra]